MIQPGIPGDDFFQHSKPLGVNMAQKKKKKPQNYKKNEYRMSRSQRIMVIIGIFIIIAMLLPSLLYFFQ
jgi:hypothetical protein